MLFDEHKDNADQKDPNNPYNIEGQGKQIGYEDYLQYKQDFNDSRTLSYSSSDLYKKRIRERDAALLDSAFWATTVVGAGTLLYHQASRNDSIRYLLQEAPLASLARHKLTKQFQDNKAAGLIAGAIDPRLGHSPQTVGASLHSMLLGLEELSPMQLMKTLQLSSFSSLFVEVIDEQHEQARHIKGSSIANYGDYYKNMIKKEAGIDLSADDLNRGFILDKGKLYKALPGKTEGQVVRGDKLLDHARIVATGIKTGEDAISTNRVFEKLANGYGVNIKRHMINAEPLAIVGANSKEDLITNWVRAYGRFSVELGARSLDNPLGFIEEYVNMSGGGSKIFNSKAYQTLKKYSNIQLGSGGVYNTTTRDMLTRTGKNLAVKGAALTVGLNLADIVVENIAPEDSAWANGIISGLADTAMKIHIKFAEIWSDNFQAIKKAQEFAAPGSTELTSLLGLTLAGTMVGANAAYAHRMYDNTRLGVDASSAKHIQERRIGGKLGDALDKIGKNKPTTTLGRYSKVGALAGAALALPFLPGALIGKSSDELRAEYSGEKEVAVKSTRYWLSGGGDYRGGKVEYHRDHLLKVLATDAETKTLYGDRETKRSLNPILKPFAYLSNPYRFEEMHTHDAPMPVWGMDTSYGSFLGQMFRGTAGQFIKPTVVHPDLQKEQDALLAGHATLSLRGNLTNLAKAVEKGLQEEVHNKQTKGSPPGVARSSSSNLSADQHYLPWLATEQEMTYGQGVNIDSETYATPEQEKKDVKSLIEDGMMLRKNAPTNEPYFRSFQGAYSGAEEFVGLKGFVSGLTVGLSGAHPVDQLRPELEISGSTTNASKAIQNLALGDAMGCFLPGTPVLTKNGYKPIEEITEKDKVISLNGVPRKVREAYYMIQTNIEVLRVYVEGLPLPINCTPDHRFPSILQSNIAIDDREIGSLREGDYLLQLNEDYKEKRSRWDVLPGRNLQEGVYRLSKIIRIERTIYSGLVYDLGVYVTPYYTVSGILCHNSGEFLRRLFPQSASARRETINPMRNLVAPEWLPSNDTKYYKNFSRGSYFCLAPYSTVETDTLDFKPASEVKVGDKLIDKKGRPTEVKRVEEIPSEYVYKICVNGAMKEPTYLTGEHPVAVRVKNPSDKHEAFRHRYLKAISKVCQNTEVGKTYRKDFIKELLGISSCTGTSPYIKLLEKEGYIVTTKKTFIRTSKEGPDPYLTEKGIEFVEMKDIKVGDYVAYPRNFEYAIQNTFDMALITPEEWVVSDDYIYYNRSKESVEAVEYLLGESEIRPKDNKHVGKLSRKKLKNLEFRKCRFKRHVQLTRELGEFCGLWLAEGSIRNTAHHIKELEEVKKIYDKLGLTYSVHFKGDKTVSLKYSYKWLDLFVEHLFGRGARNKRLNSCLLHFPKEFLEGLVEMYYYGDGCYQNKRGRLSFQAVSASPILHKQLKVLLLRRLGIVSIHSECQKQPRDIVISGRKSGVSSGFSSTLSIRDQDSHSNLWDYDEDFFYFRVMHIDKEPCSKVYAFETEDHTFCTYSILTHNSHNEMGEVLTPGTKGFETLNPELKNVDPNEIPLVYQYKVLQNIANKSPEHLAIKEHLVRNLDKLSQKEKDIFFEAYGQDEAKERLKEFNEYAEDGEKSRMGLFAVHNAIWETVAHKENPLEPLLPFRPMAKFVHQRTAIEDYEKTQMMGPDTGIWTNPFSHFIKPAANRVVKNAHGGFVPEEYEEKNRVDQYFDKLALIKADKNGNIYEKERNLTALAYTGVRNAEDMRKFKMALSTEQRAYVESFSREKDQEKRQKILQMVPNDIGRIYQSVWKNIDNYDIAIKKGLDPKAYLDELYLKETGKMASITKVELSRKEKQEIRDKEYADKTFLEERKLKKLEEAKALRLKAATKEAYKYVEKQTGKVPGEDWVGWDPRLTVDDIKLKTLLVGREDIHKYGYWGTDVERIERLVALDRDNQVTDDLEKIKRELRSQSQNQITLTNKLRNAGFEVSRVNTSPASKSSLTIKETEEYLNDYYQK